MILILQSYLVFPKNASTPIESYIHRSQRRRDFRLSSLQVSYSYYKLTELLYKSSILTMVVPFTLLSAFAGITCDFR